MQNRGKLLKIYVGEREQYHNKPLYHYLVNWLKQRGLGGVTVIRGIEGFGQDQVVHTARILELSSDLPIVLEMIDEAEKIEALLPELCKMVPRGLVISTDVTIHKYGKEIF